MYVVRRMFCSLDVVKGSFHASVSVPLINLRIRLIMERISFLVSRASVHGPYIDWWGRDAA